MSLVPPGVVEKLRALITRLRNAGRIYLLHLTGQLAAWYSIGTHDLTKWQAAIAVAGTGGLTGLLSKLNSWLGSSSTSTLTAELLHPSRYSEDWLPIAPRFPHGLRGALPHSGAPMAMFRKHLKSALTKPAAPFDYARKVVGGFPMALNDQLGNCTIAGFFHLAQLAYAAVGRALEYPGDAAIAAAYWSLVGHGPTYVGDPGPGLQLEQVLRAAMSADGLLGIRVAAYGAVDPSDIELMIDGAYNFGGLYLAGNIPATAETQFEDNDGTWALEPGRHPGVGGHCFVGSGSDLEAVFDNETWGAENTFTFAWWKKYGLQGYVVIFECFVAAGHGPLANLDLDGLKAELAQIAA